MKDMKVGLGQRAMTKLDQATGFPGSRSESMWIKEGKAARAGRFAYRWGST